MASVFPTIPSTIDTSSNDFTKRGRDWGDVLAKHKQAVEWCVSEGHEKYVSRHIERGMLLGILYATIN